MDNLVPLTLSDAEKIELLRKSRWLRDMRDDKITQFASYLNAFEAASGAVILTEGKKISFFGVVCDGDLNIMKVNADGGGQMINKFSTGSVIGIVSFFDEGVCSASAIVQQFATLLLMDRKSFETFCREAPEAALQVTLHLVKTLSLNLRETTARWVDGIR